MVICSYYLFFLGLVWEQWEWIGLHGLKSLCYSILNNKGILAPPIPFGHPPSKQTLSIGKGGTVAVQIIHAPITHSCYICTHKH